MHMTIYEQLAEYRVKKTLVIAQEYHRPFAGHIFHAESAHSEQGNKRQKQEVPYNFVPDFVQPPFHTNPTKKMRVNAWVSTFPIMHYVLITIKNSHFVRGNLFSNKYLPFYSRAFTTLKGMIFNAEIYYPKGYQLVSRDSNTLTIFLPACLAA
jgi:hypothetical protein